MFKQLCRASGYMAIFLVPTLLLLGMQFKFPALAFFVVMLVFPLTRKVFAPVRADEEASWHEGVATGLHHLPLLYAPLLALAVGSVPAYLATSSAESQLSLGMSLWITMLFSTCAAHELVHRREKAHALIGHLIAGLAGYPFLAQEHFAHHGRAGDIRNAEWPKVEESVWTFAWRRARRILRDAYAPRGPFWNPRAGTKILRGLRLATGVTLATAVFMWWFGGRVALQLYLASAAGAIFGVQVINYIQHWGLGDDRQGDRARQGLAWEDDCRFQAWCTFGISLHQSHHDRSAVPYYLLTMKPDSPRLPAGYVVLMLLSLVPALWRRWMLPALEHWERAPHSPRSPGRQLSCFSAYPRSRSADLSR